MHRTQIEMYKALQALRAQYPTSEDLDKDAKRAIKITLMSAAISAAILFFQTHFR